MATTAYAPYADENPWRLDTFMNAEEWKEVSRWYPFSLRSLMPDGRWFEYARCKSRDNAYQIMKVLAAGKPRDYFVIVQCTLVGKDGREKAVVFSGGSEQTILQERQCRIKAGWTAPAEQQTTQAPAKKPSVKEQPENSSVEERLKAVIVSTIQCDERDIVDSAALVEDLGADSLDLIEFMIALEEEFDIRVNEEDAENMVTVGDALKFLADKGIH